jgi:hypothetical protein
MDRCKPHGATSIFIPLLVSFRGYPPAPSGSRLLFSVERVQGLFEELVLQL